MRVPVHTVTTLFQVHAPADLQPRYNIAPSQPIAVVRQPAESAQRELVMLRWGLIPSWVKGEDRLHGTINAQSETAATKPSFRNSFRRRRCLVPADAFYEWKTSGKKKHPFAFCMTDRRPFAFAGIWDRWESAEGVQLETVALLTTSANELVRPLHERMPVILQPEDYASWLDPHLQDAARVQAFLRAYPADEMMSYPVSDWVNNARNEGERCLREVRDEQPTLF